MTYWGPNYGYPPPQTQVQFIPVPSEPTERKSLYDRVTDDLNGLKALQKLLKEEKKDGDGEKKEKTKMLTVGEATSWVVLAAIPVAITQLLFLHMLKEALKF